MVDKSQWVQLEDVSFEAGLLLISLSHMLM